MHPSSIRLHWVRVPLWDPFRISNGEVSVKDAILVQIEAGGTTGWGEASPLAGSAYSGETPQSTWDFLRQRLVPALLEQPELDPLRCFERTFRENLLQKQDWKGRCGTSMPSRAACRCGSCWEAISGRSRQERQ